MDQDAHQTVIGRWGSEIRAVLVAVAVLVLICAALIAEALWGNGAMLAILLGGLAIGLIIRYARVPGAGSHGRPRTH
jgi:hypothetical protein